MNSTKCMICGTEDATRIEHILNPAFISDVNYSQSMYPIISLTGDGRNMMPVCEHCNNVFNRIMIPTLDTIKTDFKHFNVKMLKAYAEFLRENRDALDYYISEMCVGYNEEIGLFQVRMLYMQYSKAFREFNELYDRGYFK